MGSLYRQASPNNPLNEKQRARNRIVWNLTEDILRPAEADVLEIFDWLVVAQRINVATDQMPLVVTRVLWDSLEAKTGTMPTSKENDNADWV